MAMRTVQYFARIFGYSEAHAYKLIFDERLHHVRQRKRTSKKDEYLNEPIYDRIGIPDESILEFCRKYLHRPKSSIPSAEILAANLEVSEGKISPADHLLIQTKWLRVSEAARYLSISVSSVYDLVKQGRITYLRVIEVDSDGMESCGTIRLSEFHLERYLHSRPLWDQEAG